MSLPCQIHITWENIFSTHFTRCFVERDTIYNTFIMLNSAKSMSNYPNHMKTIQTTELYIYIYMCKYSNNKYRRKQVQCNWWLSKIPNPVVFISNLTSVSISMSCERETGFINVLHVCSDMKLANWKYTFSSSVFNYRSSVAMATRF